MAYRNKEDEKKYKRNYYLHNRDAVIKKNRDRRKDLKLWYKDFKSKLKCIKCSETHPACIDFHHPEGVDKEVGVSEAVRRGFSKERLLALINECIPLCANCHRKEHWNGDYEV